MTRRLEVGGALAFSGVAAPAQPFLAALLQNLFPQRPVVVVTDNLKTQESFQQDLESWLGAPPLFFPAWEVFPHEGKLPHADVISDRLQTLVALAVESKDHGPKSKVVVTSVTALLQKTFAPDDLEKHTRLFKRGDKIAPLDLIEILEEQGYEPEAQVTQKGEIALRGGILDVFPPTSPWPARLEFFGDELESHRFFDPLTQISREEITEIVIPPAGELGILKRSTGGPLANRSFSTLLDYLPRETMFIFCGPEQLALRADEYAAQIPGADPFFISWPDFLVEMNRRGFTSVELSDAEAGVQALACSPDRLKPELQLAGPVLGAPLFASLDAFRPLAERAPEPQIAEAQRREFFQQLHRWLRQDYVVHVFCNNDGERQRFQEVWKEISPQSAVHSPELDNGTRLETVDAGPWTHLGSLSRGFICDEAKLVVVTDAEIFRAIQNPASAPAQIIARARHPLRARH